MASDNEKNQRVWICQSERKIVERWFANGEFTLCVIIHETEENGNYHPSNNTLLEVTGVSRAKLQRIITGNRNRSESTPKST